MIPISDDNRGRRIRPFVSYAIIAVNILVFLYQLTLPSGAGEQALFEFITRWGAVPDQVAGGEQLLTLVTSQFLHGGWLHIGSNMLFLWVFGDNVEDVMGHLNFLIFYLLTGIIAALAQVLIDTGSTIPLVGASGAISGVLAAYVILFPHGKIQSLVFIGIFFTMVMIPAWVQIGLWVLLQFVNGFASLGVQTAETGGGVAYFAHIGGFLAGLALVWLFRNEEALQRQRAAREGVRSFQRMGWRRR